MLMADSQANRKRAERLQSLLDLLLDGLIERETEVRLALLAALSGEHMLLIGPPGTAKSELARRLHKAFDGPAYFERLLTRFTVPEEVLGPLSIQALEEDRYERKTEGYLPNASIAFIDEIFKANSAILNALLTLLNERLFDQGSQRIPVPLVCVIGASNELPEDDGLDALYDRFLIRCHVTPGSESGFEQLVDLGPPSSVEVPAGLRLDQTSLREIRQAAESVALGEEARSIITELRGWLNEQQIVVSDRRWRQIIKILRVSAATNGRAEVSEWDCWLLQHCTWSKPEDREAVFDCYRRRLGAISTSTPAELQKVVSVWKSRLERQREKVQKRNSMGKPLYWNSEGKETTEETPEPYDAYGQRRRDRKNQPVLEAPRFSQAEIDLQLHELSNLLEDIRVHGKGLEERSLAVQRDVSAHLWIEPKFAGVADAAIRTEAAELQKLQKRIESIGAAVRKLPRAKGKGK